MISSNAKVLIKASGVCCKTGQTKWIGLRERSRRISLLYIDKDYTLIMIRLPGGSWCCAIFKLVWSLEKGKIYNPVVRFFAPQGLIKSPLVVLKMLRKTGHLMVKFFTYICYFICPKKVCLVGI